MELKQSPSQRSLKLVKLLAIVLTLPLMMGFTFADVNDEVYKVSDYYVSQSDYIPDTESTALLLLALTSLENTGVSTEVHSAVRMTPDVMKNDPRALASFTANNNYGLPTYSGYYYGPLSLSGKFTQAILPQELGNTGSRVNSVDRSNWYDSCNLMTYYLDEAWSNYNAYYNKGEFKRQVNSNGVYHQAILSAMAAHQGSSVLQQPDAWMPTGFAENASPEFWFEWTDICTQPKYVTIIRDYIRTNGITKYSNDQDINEELIIPILNSVKKDALRKDPSFFASNRYTSSNSWITGNTTYMGYVGSSGEKTSASIKVLVALIIMEENYRPVYI